MCSIESPRPIAEAELGNLLNTAGPCSSPSWILLSTGGEETSTLEHLLHMAQARRHSAIEWIHPDQLFHQLMDMVNVDQKKFETCFNDHLKYGGHSRIRPKMMQFTRPRQQMSYTLLTKAALNKGRLKFKEGSLNLRRLFVYVNFKKSQPNSWHLKFLINKKAP